MKRTVALREVRRLASERRIFYTDHAEERMRERSISRDEVSSALVGARTVLEQANGTWKVTGPAVDDERLTLVVVIMASVLVVTVWGVK